MFYAAHKIAGVNEQLDLAAIRGLYHSMRKYILMLSLVVTMPPLAYAQDFKCEENVFQSGKASIYANSLAGSLTKTEEPLKLSAFTAAHRKLPMNSYVKIEDEQTGKSVVVRINDRGPFVKNRILDVTPGVKNELNWDNKKGLHRIKMYLCKPAS